MNPTFLYPADEDLKDQSDKPDLTIDGAPLSEGGEFLDDALRMKDLPLMFSEDKIDTWRNHNLL
ncbi:hypothetical protein ACEN9X_27590 [Mucilaginibacter sp. Mucisp86]|uniref:hypothetical protein n=1 Tax=Mucilaginibacter sp. Mucisp86 TaxID=3243060 RepID=UPI0039B3E271